MSVINLKFDTINKPIVITVENNINAQSFADNINQILTPADHITHDIQTYADTVDEFLINAKQGNKLFNFSWNLTNLSQDNFNLMHRDIENFNIDNYPNLDINAELFLFALHDLLHQAESAWPKLKYNLSTADRHPSTIRVKWYGNSHPWPTQPTFIHRSKLVPGDIIADYPHVGKTPLSCMQHNDISNLETMCKLPDAYPPSFYIILRSTTSNVDDVYQRNKLIQWYDQYTDRLSSKFSKDQLLNYYGEFKIGSISHEQLEILRNNRVFSCSIAH